MGPSGIMSLDSFGDVGGAGAGGADTDAGGGYDTGAGGGGFSGRGPNETKSAFDARTRNQREIMQKAEQRQAERLGYNERQNIADFRSRRGPFGLGSLFSTALGFVNPVLGLASRAVMGIPGVRSVFDRFGFGKTEEEDDGTTLAEQVSPDLPFAQSYLDSLQTQMANTTPQISNFSSGFKTGPVTSGRFNTNQTINTNIGTGASRNMVDIDQQFMDGGIVDLVDIYD
tara:strand:- start:41 stop:724 length:684 start_codon:yes stop_codon:yes gene_type:complete